MTQILLHHRPRPAARDPRRRYRDLWRRSRLHMETTRETYTPGGVAPPTEVLGFRRMLGLFHLAIRALGLYDRGVRNAHDIRLKRLDLAFAALPPQFDGFRILQLSDLHVDHLAGPLEVAAELAAGEAVDLCVLTGDYRKRISGPFEQILPALDALRARLTTRHGVYAILGNHDCADMAEAFEALGIEVLINETRSLERAGAEIHVTGTDDVHAYYTEAARAALGAAPEGFKIALVHSAEFADAAAEAGFHLYLAGHTHGGQVCLPGGIPIVTHMRRHRRYASGLWRHGAMLGYTTSGVGVSALPVRFNSRGEVVLITLRRA